MTRFQVSLKPYLSSTKVPEDIHDALVEELWFHPRFGGAIPLELHPHAYEVCHGRAAQYSLFALTNASLWIECDATIEVRHEYGLTPLLCPKFWIAIPDPPISDFNLPLLESHATKHLNCHSRYTRLDKSINTFLHLPGLTNDVFYTLWPWLHAKAQKGRHSWKRNNLPTPLLKRTSQNLAKVQSFLAEHHPGLIEQAEEDRLYLEFQKVPL